MGTAVPGNTSRLRAAPPPLPEAARFTWCAHRSESDRPPTRCCDTRDTHRTHHRRHHHWPGVIAHSI